MANQKISALTALAGADVADDDVLAIVDTSVTTTKKIAASEMRIAMKSVPATQAQQETGTSAIVTVTPSTQQFHPSAAKAWGLITPATTVSASYPAAGVSVVQNGAGDFTVTHGVTFSGVYACVPSYLSVGANLLCGLSERTTTTFRVLFKNDSGGLADPTSFSYVCFGDLA